MTIRFLVFLALISCFAACSKNASDSTISESQLEHPSILQPTPESKPEIPVKVVGDFTNVKVFGGEHQAGFSVQLWKHGDNLCGLISGSSDSRLYGDPPTGLLENIFFETDTGKLKFRAVMPGEVVEFDGVLSKEILSGKLTNHKTENITLKRSKEATADMDEYQTFKEWAEFTDGILKFRGPRGN